MDILTVNAAAPLPTDPSALWSNAILDLLQTHEFPAALTAMMQTAQERYWSGDTSLAHAQALAALKLAQEIGWMQEEALLFKLLAQMAFDEGRSKDGHDHLLDAIALFQELDQWAEAALLTRWYAEHLSFLGALPEAKAAFKLAHERFLNCQDEAAAAGCLADLQAIEALD